MKHLPVTFTALLMGVAIAVATGPMTPSQNGTWMGNICKDEPNQNDCCIRKCRALYSDSFDYYTCRSACINVQNPD